MENSNLVGSEKEVAILQSLLKSNEAELVSVIGRRRVGKTFLVQSVYTDHIVFDISDIQNTSNREQLKSFSIALDLYAKSVLPTKQNRVDERI